MQVTRWLKEFWGGYPGGWKKYARGMQGNRTPPFIPASDPHDSRNGIPPAGLREYWDPALPAKAVGRRRPVGLRIMETDLVFFRDQEGEVRALWDYCPHRGVYLSWCKCFWQGYITCPYHGAMFSGTLLPKRLDRWPASRSGHRRARAGFFGVSPTRGG